MYSSSRERFEVVPRNSSNVKVKDIDMLQQITRKYEEMFDRAYGDAIEEVDSSYIAFPSTFVFGYNAIFKDVVLKELKLQTGDTNMRLVRDISNVNWKDVNDTRSFIFDIEFGSGSFISTLRVNLIITSLAKYGLQSGKETLDNPILQVNGQDIQIRRMSVAKLPKQNTIVHAYDGSDYQSFHRIRNRLGLTDPFITDGKDMHIYDDMKDSFNKILENKV